MPYQFNENRHHKIPTAESGKNLGHQTASGVIVVPEPTVTLPKMWIKVLVRAFAAIFYETDPDGESQYCRKLCDYPRALGDPFGAWTKTTDRMQCISPA